VGNGSRTNQQTEIRSYRDLVAWQRAFSLGMAVYRATGSFPDHERYGLTSQLRRGAVSIASNIAEGYGRGSRLDYVRFLRTARGALFEVETQLRFAQELRYLPDDLACQLTEELNDTARVLSGLIQSLERPEG
jgi:four helix bundle protein